VTWREDYQPAPRPSRLHRGGVQNLRIDPVTRDSLRRGPPFLHGEEMAATFTGPFDRVDVLEGSAARSFTPTEFLSLPLASRIGHVIRGQCRFFRGGALLDTREALAALRQMAEN
jgi:hypothetical protein